MKLSDIASVSGKGGLFKVLSSHKSGLILESLDDHKIRLVATPNHRISILHEISVYTNTKEGTISLEAVLKKIKKEFGKDLGIEGDSEANELKSFMKSVLPEYDENRVYVSDIKKLLKWYSILYDRAPEIFDDSGQAEDSSGIATN